MHWWKPWRKSRTPQRVKPERPVLFKPRELFRMPTPAAWWTADGRTLPDPCLPEAHED